MLRNIGMPYIFGKLRVSPFHWLGGHDRVFVSMVAAPLVSFWFSTEIICAYHSFPQLWIFNKFSSFYTILSFSAAFKIDVLFSTGFSFSFFLFFFFVFFFFLKFFLNSIIMIFRFLANFFPVFWRFSVAFQVWWCILVLSILTHTNLSESKRVDEVLHPTANMQHNSTCYKFQSEIKHKLFAESQHRS